MGPCLWLPLTHGPSLVLHGYVREPRLPHSYLYAPWPACEHTTAVSQHFPVPLGELANLHHLPSTPTSPVVTLLYWCVPAVVMLINVARAGHYWLDLRTRGPKPGPWHAGHPASPVSPSLPK